MRIQHNIPAMNALSNYTRNNNALAANLEKLSSGYRINSAADDAAGLAISEKMRSQIKGLEKAYDNANDGISLVQTAEGALTEVNSMLTRLTELATQSANGTYQEEVDREAIQEETDAILDEIDRISKATNFNGINLLDGSLGSASQVKGLSMDTKTAVAGKYTIKQAFADSVALDTLTTDDIGKTIDYTVTWKDASGKEQTTTASFTFQGAGDGTVSTTKANNYFTDASGNKVNLDTNGKLAKATFDAAVVKALKSNEEFNDQFTVSVVSDKLTLEAKTAGSAGAVAISAGAISNLSITPFTANTGATIAGDGMAIETTKAADAKQFFNLADGTDMVVVDADEKEDIEKKVFEIDGHKFVLVQNDMAKNTINNIKETLGSDVNMIEIKDATYAQADDAEEVAAQIAKVTGLSVKGYGTASTADNAAAGDIIFDDKLKLGGGKGGLTLQVGDTNDSFQKVTVAIEDMSSKGIGIAGLNLSTQESAGNAIKTIKDAVNTVSAQRGRLGALQNRLDHTLNNLDATTENITSAESQIRDVNMAKEMTAYTKNNILAQAAQSMLAQANSMPQGVLQLLQ